MESDKGAEGDPESEPAEELDLGPLELVPAVVREGRPRPVESTRATLAYLLFGLLACLIGALLGLLGSGVLTVQQFTDVTGVLLAPVVGLLGAATGYYYGRGDR